MSTVIQIENLSKEYRLGVIGHGTLYRDLQSWWAVARGKEDPNSIVGSGGTSKAQGRILAVENVNLEVREGEVLGIIGRNGAGKSTLLKILSRVTAPSSGLVKIRGRVASLLEVGTGFHSELTGRENIYLNGAINGMNKREVRGKLDQIVEFSGVEQFLDTPVKRYSSGMLVRLGFAVAAHLEPDILVVDEVLAVGDFDFQRKCIGKIRDVSKGEGRTVLFVSHNLGSVKDLCSRTVLLEKGRKVMEGETNDVISHYTNTSVQRGGEWVVGDPLEEDDCCDDLVRVKAARLLDDSGEVCEFFTVRESIHVRIEYDLPVVMESLHVGIFLNNKSEQNVIFTFDCQHNGRLLSKREPGRYVSTCKIPGDLLNDGSYSVIVKVHDNVKTYFEGKLNSFEVKDIKDPEGARGLWNLGAQGKYPETMIRPKLDWDVEYSPF
jgi:lipopolysaccharide transport system ATP-binding protein